MRKFARALGRVASAPFRFIWWACDGIAGIVVIVANAIADTITGDW